MSPQEIRGVERVVQAKVHFQKCPPGPNATIRSPALEIPPSDHNTVPSSQDTILHSRAAPHRSAGTEGGSSHLMKHGNMKTRGEKGHRSINSSCQGPWLGGRAGKSLRPWALGHRPARVSNSAVGQVGGSCRLLSQCFDLHGDKGNTRSKFKIYSASCSSLGLRKREREMDQRGQQASGALRRCQTPRCSGSGGYKPKAFTEEGAVPQGTRCDLGAMGGDK